MGERVYERCALLLQLAASISHCRVRLLRCSSLSPSESPPFALSLQATKGALHNAAGGGRLGGALPAMTRPQLSILLPQLLALPFRCSSCSNCSISLREPVNSRTINRNQCLNRKPARRGRRVQRVFPPHLARDGWLDKGEGAGGSC